MGMEAGIIIVARACGAEEKHAVHSFHLGFLGESIQGGLWRIPRRLHKRGLAQVWPFPIRHRSSDFPILVFLWTYSGVREREAGVGFGRSGWLINLKPTGGLQNLILQIQKIGLSIAKSKYFSCIKWMHFTAHYRLCLLYTSDAADETDGV